MTSEVGNGSMGGEGIQLVVEELRPDWVVIRAALSEFRKQVELERLPGLLDRTLTAWLQERPMLRVRSALGVVEDGFTVALHIWFDAS